MELWDIYDSEGRLTGRTIARGEPLKTGDYHLVVHVWVIDPYGRFLIQRRADCVKLFPGIWASTGGSALAGEDSVSAALRELREEMGVTAQTSELVKLGRIKRRDNLLDIWLLRKSVELEGLQLQQEEVSAAKLIGLKAMLQIVEAGTFFDYGEDYFKLLLAALDR